MIRTRRWPFVTTGIIAVSLIVFLFTHAELQQEQNQYAEIESQSLSVLAVYPQVPVTAAQQALIESFRKNNPQDWERMASARGASANLDEVTVKIRELSSELDDFQSNSVTARFALYSPHLSSLSRLTANFLSRSWAHLIFGVCFLWMVGGTLEDVWGWRIFAGISFISALAGVWAYTTVYGDRPIPLIGASGMIAALMGFYVIRFPKTTIEHGNALWAVRPRLLRFSSPVYVVFPAWLLCLVFWGKASNETTNVAYLAQGAAFAVGGVLALLLRVTGIQGHVSQEIEAKVAVSVDPHIATAAQHLERGDLDAAINAVNAQIADKPYSVEAHEMLVSLYFRKGNTAIKYMRALEALCEVQLKAANPEAAWENYETYLKSGGQKMPADPWLQLARFAENQGNLDRAVSEYEALAQAWPRERASVLAMISAGRIHLQLGRREDAKRLYLAAQNSEVPHPQWDDIIRKGLEKAGGVAAAPKAEPVSSKSRTPKST